MLYSANFLETTQDSFFLYVQNVFVFAENAFFNVLLFFERQL